MTDEQRRIKFSKVRRYKKKPVVIEALEWTGDNLDEIKIFIPEDTFSYTETTGLYIHTLEGDHLANIGDFIIKGIKGEFYPCKPDIFKQTYEKVL